MDTKILLYMAVALLVSYYISKTMYEKKLAKIAKENPEFDAPKVAKVAVA